MANAFTPLVGTASQEFFRWYAANSTNGTPFGVLPVRTTAPPINGTGWIQTTCGKSVFVVDATNAPPQVRHDGQWGDALAHNVIQIRFFGVGANNGTTNYRISGACRSVFRGAAGSAQGETSLWVPTPLAAGVFTLGTLATGSGIVNEFYADTISLTTANTGARSNLWSADVNTFLADSVATLELDYTGFEYLLLETDIAAGTTSNNAEFRFY